MELGRGVRYTRQANGYIPIRCLHFGNPNTGLFWLVESNGTYVHPGLNAAKFLIAHLFSIPYAVSM
jgi:hypothetical protein